ncbi:amidohydrolase [Thalassospira sp.]|uniref:amidohydrolase family protein n=1 Tax=Thalassospira sp. TaxID=1912094 RepID=UPI0027354D8B|nr:amidohydrolase family protein [Thalassospira sp.]MDP2700237.1 amidohydrolase family protein [Thalassospira sp.]
MTLSTVKSAGWIDAHQHFWQPARGDYGWLTPDLTALYRDFMPGDLQEILAQQGIARTVVVQAAPSVAETAFLLDLAARHDFIAGVVGWIDFGASDAVDHLRNRAQNPTFVGVRPMIQDIADIDWMLNPAFDPVFQTLIDLDLAFDALVHPRHLSNLHRLVMRYPDLRVVIDHGAKPKIRNGIHGPDGYDTWAPLMTEFAPLGSVSCKISGLLTEAGPGAGLHDLKPYLDHLLRVFGADRLMWGSDWPVLELAGDYAAWADMSHRWLGGLRSDDSAKIAGTTAAKFYRMSKNAG